MGYRQSDKPKNTTKTLNLLSIVFLACLMGVSISINTVTILAGYLGISLVTFVVYWIDKRAAKQGKQRTPEVHLHLLALFGGWLGAHVAQQRLRHKSSKQNFRRVFYCTIALNIAGIIYLYHLGVIEHLKGYF